MRKHHWVYDPFVCLYLPLRELDGASFMSRDHYGHLCTVAGARWTPEGYSYDKVDDVITIPDHVAVQNIFDSPGGSLVAWVKANSDGEGDNGTIYQKVNVQNLLVTNEAPGYVKINFTHAFSGTVGNWITTNAVMKLEKSNLIVVTYDNSNVANVPTIYLNGNPVALTITTAPVGTRTSDVGGAVAIGNRADTSRTWDGIIHEIRARRGKMLALAEIADIYLADDWRLV